LHYCSVKRFYRLLFLLLPLLITACSTFRADIAESPKTRGWLGKGGSIAQSSFRKSGPRPPLELVETISFEGAPPRNLVAIDSTIIVATQNGKIYTCRIGQGKKGKALKLPHNNEGMVVAQENGLLIIGLIIGNKTLFCYDLKKGKYLWQTRAGLLASEPVLDDGSVFVAARLKHVDRYDMLDGKRIWRFDLDSQIHTTPAISGNILAFGSDSGTIYGLKKSSGEKIWQQKLDSPIFASPVIAGDRVFFASLHGTIYAFSLSMGRLQWTYKATGWIRRTPATNASVLIIGAGDGSVEALEEESGRILWRFEAGAGIGTTPLIVGDVIYVGSLDHHLYALSVAEGKLLWKKKLDGRVRTNPIVFGDYLIAGSEDRNIYVFRNGKSDNEQ